MGKRRLRIGFGLLLVAFCLPGTWTVAGQQKELFRVCSDPENLPFSSRKLEGFENRIADVVAKEFGTTPSYVWWGQRKGFIRNTMFATLKEQRCDIVIGIPEGDPQVLTTKPYYRSTYVFVYPKGRGLQIKSLDDPILKKIKIGVHLLGDDYNNPPPVHELSKRGIVDNVVGFDTIYSSENPPNKIIDAVVRLQIGAAIVWGPAEGFYVKQQQAVPLEMVPVPSGKTDLPFAFNISMGVRPGDEALKRRLEKVLDSRQVEIRKILMDYGVPLLDMKPTGKVSAK